LALLYNAPRAATIISDEDCLLWVLDRNTFNHIVKDSASKKREKYEKFMSEIEILSTIETYERSKISDAFKELTYKKGEYIIKEGDEGDIFYFMEHGEAKATKTLK
jgi:cAMP-dependent protein kinase regulator